MAAALSDIDRHPQALVPVALHALEGAAAHADTQTKGFGSLGRRVGRAELARVLDGGIHQFFKKGPAVTEAGLGVVRGSGARADV